MGTKVSKTTIGAFVLGATALFVAAVLFLGASTLFTKRQAYITYFDDSVKGLNIGSPVMFRGVKVGEVIDISLVADPVRRTLKIPIIFTIEHEKVKGVGQEFREDPRLVEKAVKEYGLRSQLQLMSIVTGQLMVTLDFSPDKPTSFIGLNKSYTEIPSIPTPFEQFQKTIEDMPLRDVVKSLVETLDATQRLVKSVDVKSTVQALESTIKDVQVLVRHTDAKIDPLVAGLLKTAAVADETLKGTRETMASARVEMKEVSAAAQSALQSAQAALKQSERTLQTYSEDSRLVTELNKNLRSLSAASRSLQNLSDYLERHPESLLQGKTQSKGD